MENLKRGKKKKKESPSFHFTKLNRNCYMLSHSLKSQTITRLKKNPTWLAVSWF